MEDLQNLLEKINRDGVEKAEAEAKKIVDAARAQAEEIVKKATAEAAQLRTDSEKDAAAHAARATETIRQSARDVVLGVRDAVTALLESLLVKNVNQALADEKTAADLAVAAIQGLTGPGEITCGPRLAQALGARLAADKSFTVTTDAALESGFAVKLDGGRVEHAFTGDVIAAELAKRLRPDLAALLK